MIKFASGMTVRILFLLLGISGFLSCESAKREEVDLEDIPNPISFSEHIIPIFEQKCIQCHDGTTPPDLRAENAYLELTGGGYVNVNDPEGSKLYQAIDLGGSMYQYATDKDRAYILRWIETGAEDN